jgi:hypothetical protein
VPSAGMTLESRSGSPMREIRADTFDMQIWLVEV